ncbi:MAG: M23 family metallopeptidase [Bdellovibrionales bacterium]|nr:M23 family metallopeptidase [Bdellovibrionales bacterium]
MIKLKLPKANFSAELLCEKQIITFQEKEGYSFAFYSESYFSKMKQVNCYYHFDSGEKVPVASIQVHAKEFPKEQLRVDRKRVELSPKNLKRAIREKEILNKIYKKQVNEPLFDNSFRLPINSKVTSIYGTKRLFNKKKKGQHLGTDYRAKVGTPIKTANRGKVVLARHLFFTGNTVIIDHGMGIFTMYGHLSKFKVKENMTVDKKNIIGLAGRTGRVTGAHLHWGVKVHGNWVDGNSLIIASLTHE